MRRLFSFLCILVPSLALKEQVPLENIPENEKHLLIELVKRLGKDSDYDLGWREKPVSLSCQVTTQNTSIIKRIDSENNGAKFLTLHDDVETNQACSNMCCKNASCDLAVYENKGEHHCYLFKCDGKCLFGHHSSYISSLIQRPQSVTDGSELDLMNLDQDSDTLSGGGDKDENAFVPQTPPPTVATPAPPTPTPYIRAHSVGLEGPFCQRDLHCEDPNAVCNYHKCRCRQGYYQKGHICRQNCPPSNFGCLELGTLGRGPQCVPADQVCDRIMQCADGSDEFNCHESDSPFKSPEADDKDSSIVSQQGDKTDKEGGGSVDNNKPEIPTQTHTKVLEHNGEASSSDDKGQPSSKISSPQTSKDSKNDDNKPNNAKDTPHKPSDSSEKDPEPSSSNDQSKEKNQKSSDKDSSSSKDTLTDKADNFPKPSSSSSDLTKDGDNMEEPFEKSGSGEAEDMIRSQNAFIAKVKLDHSVEPANMQGPIIALSLGLAFTLILLLFVACRLRMVRRRLRKGRPLHSNEADYLINGMYL